MFDVKYPNIEVQLSSEDGNAMMIIGRVRSSLRGAKVSHKEIEEFTEEAMSGDYNNVLIVAMRWVSVI